MNTMKIFKIVLSLAMMAFMFAGCEEDGDKAVLKKNVAPNQLKTLASNDIVLTKATKDNVVTIEWTEPDYGFSGAVTYVLVADYAGNDFEDGVEVVTTFNKGASITVAAFNDAMLALGLTPEEPAEIELRVVSSLNHNAAPIVFSNSITVEVTAYATTFPPIYGMGDGLKGWGPWPDNAVEWQAVEDQFNKFETVTYLTSGKAFRWFKQTNWDPIDYDYPFFTGAVDEIFENANDNDSNLKIVGASGWYRITVDLTAKTVEAESVAEPVLYMMGDALNGWGPWPGAAVKMTYIKPGVFVADASFIQGKLFRFFTQADWGPGYNFEYFTTVDPKFVLNSPDNDKNFKYTAASGAQKITVDLNAKTVTLGTPPDPELFITGDDFGWDWTDGKYMELTYKGANTFELTATLTNGKLFRFFPTKGWDPSYKYGYFTTVDSDLESQGAATDDNFRYIGVTGSRKITVDMTAKTVTLD
jgi:hypothetical protein